MTQLIRGLLVPIAGQLRLVDITPDWRGIAAAVGATYVERVRIPVEGASMWVDEDGIANGHPLNRWVSGQLYPGEIYGAALILGEKNGGVDVDGLTDEQLRLTVATWGGIDLGLDKEQTHG